VDSWQFSYTSNAVSSALFFFRVGRVEATADREVQIDALLQALIARVE